VTRFDLFLWLRIAVIPAVILLLWFLYAMLQRETVKRDLFDRGCEPLHIWWMPISLYGYYQSTCFHVRYRDECGLLHKAICCVYADLMDNPFFGERRVRWYKDKIKGE